MEWCEGVQPLRQEDAGLRTGGVQHSCSTHLHGNPQNGMPACPDGWQCEPLPHDVCTLLRVVLILASFKDVVLAVSAVFLLDQQDHRLPSGPALQDESISHLHNRAHRPAERTRPIKAWPSCRPGRSCSSPLLLPLLPLL